MGICSFLNFFSQALQNLTITITQQQNIKKPYISKSKRIQIIYYNGPQIQKKHSNKQYITSISPIIGDSLIDLILFGSIPLQITELNSYTKREMKMYTVESIIGKRINKKLKRISYKVKWLNYGQDQATWEPYRNLAHLESLIQQFEINQKVNKIYNDLKAEFSQKKSKISKVTAQNPGEQEAESQLEQQKKIKKPKKTSKSKKIAKKGQKSKSAQNNREGQDASVLPQDAKKNELQLNHENPVEVQHLQQSQVDQVCKQQQSLFQCSQPQQKLVQDQPLQSKLTQKQQLQQLENDNIQKQRFLEEVLGLEHNQKKNEQKEDQDQDEDQDTDKDFVVTNIATRDDLILYLVTDHGKTEWVSREEIFRDHSEAILKFYESRIRFITASKQQKGDELQLLQK